ncbi:aromatic ring-hydroxylating oxygenase subunit alpha [Kordiimonas pumila]|uniref:Aromatic ring-hydroxylating dioxygenase subunit alpha n=1 Tax=Kordiimonas pumila TaxID=2161677 RepID=A0ABV7D5D9_9PROT|nr:aromatic ring-hydroxylating dioxygenase subunit alpha [Kordiimonas pumila]
MPVRAHCENPDRRTLADLIREYRPGYSLEQRFYKDPEIYKAEIKSIFLKHWMLAGHVSQIPEAGDFFLFEFDVESVIVVRTKEGAVKAHLNVCRHRGSRICLEKEGRSKLLTCPYHAWSYDLNGKLMTARQMGTDFKKADNGLHPVHVELVGGLIFVSLAEKPLSLAGMKEDLADVFETFGFDNMKLAAQKSFPIAANWKLAAENYQECYHCAPSHQEYAKVHAMALSKEAFAAHREKYLAALAGKVRTQESPYYFDQAKAGEEGYQYARNPLLSGMESGSLGGKGIAPLLGTIAEFDGGASEFMVGPVSFFLIYNDHMVGYRFTPTSHETCCCDVFWFVRGDADEGIDYDLETLTWLWDITTQSDEEIIVNNQQGVNSHFYTSGRLSEMESFEQHFLNWYLSSMKDSISNTSKGQ